MALVSPGVEVPVINESQYASAATNTIPYILLATAENKLDPAGTGIAQGTLEANADNIYLITSQRELVNTFGNPTFYKTSNGTAIHGHELNEYGLNAAYSVLGVTNRVYIQRANIDLAQLEASLIRPTGKPNTGTYWLDLVETGFGLFTWSQVTNTFTEVNPVIISDTADLSAGVPLSSIGTIGDYAIDVTNANNPVYYKNSSNAWVFVGSDLWKQSIPTVVGTVANATYTLGDDLVINGTTVTSTGTDLATLASDINTAAIAGVTAGVVNNRLEIYVETGNASDVTSSDVSVTIAAGAVNDLLAAIGIAAGTYNAPIYAQETHVNIPRWRTTDTTPRPTGSLWLKTTSVTNGADYVVKQYDATADAWVVIDAPLYENDQSANRFLDPANGGSAIASGTVYVQYDVNGDDTGTSKLFVRTAGATSVTGSVAAPTFAGGETFDVSVSTAGSVDLTAPVTITLSGTTAADLAADILAAGITGLSASVTASGNVQLVHTGGGVIVLTDTDGALGVAGITSALEDVRTDAAGNLIVSNWNLLSYTAASVEPGQDPVTGTNWYYSDINAIDIMVHDGGVWKGYQNVANDVRGHDLSLTDPAGPIVAATAPTTQSDGTALALGDLWVDTSNLEEFPLLRRWENVDGRDQWVLIDNTDQTSTDGVLFADARWATNGTTDPIADDLPLITDLLISDYLDIDAPEASLYPDGMLLWNTRRSGYNVKEFRQNYFNIDDFGSAVIPDVTNAWISVSGNREDGSAFFGRHAQRNMIVAAMKAAIDTNADIREEQRQFTLIACPGYPELSTNMVALNNERNNSGFVVGDTPLRLNSDSAEITTWATNNSGIGLLSNDGLVANDDYLGVFYPSGLANDLEGTPVVVPPSHMMLRAIIRSDDQSYPWLAPAGSRRGTIDNADAIGYIDSVTGEFTRISTGKGLRDVLYTNNINPITFQAGSGYINDGNKTTASGTALDRINVSRLVGYIRKQLETIGNGFVHEPNDRLTRDELKGAIERSLNDLIAKRGIYDYVVVCDTSNNTPTRIARNELWVDVAISPVKASEYIYIPLRIRNPGEV